MLRDDVDRLDRERLGAVLREHGDDHVVHNLQFSLVGGGDINQNIRSVKSDLGVVRVDNRRHGQHGSVAVIDDGVDGGVANDVKVATEVLIFLEGCQYMTRTLGEIQCTS